MICRECGHLMKLDDTDYRFEDNYDNYWVCDFCLTGCVEEIRFNQKFREHWYSDEFDNLKDYFIHYHITLE